ncbi:MAG: helix-turn-helix transcriptional regulator [Lachnospiraceae bacterium]|nr:helix-turn-helix transcriptional regulator [Lachnospiraceae bacterium]
MSETKKRAVPREPLQIVRFRDISHTNTDWHGRTIHLKEETNLFPDDSYIRFWQNEQAVDYPVHWHNAFEIILPVENHYDVNVENESFHLEPGEILLIPAGKSHSITAPDSGRRYILLFGTGSMTRIRGYSGILPLLNSTMFISANATPEIYNDVYTRITLMISDYFNENDFFEFSIYSNLMSLLVLLARFSLSRSNDNQTTSNITKKKHFNRFKHVFEYIDLHYADNLTLESVAEYSGFSKYYFSRLFKEYCGYNFYDYLVIRRIKTAELLLTQPKYTITEVALQSGFSSISTFNRTFKKLKGCTPGDYKAMYMHNSI